MINSLVYPVSQATQIRSKKQGIYEFFSNSCLVEVGMHGSVVCRSAIYCKWNEVRHIPWPRRWVECNWSADRETLAWPRSWVNTRQPMSTAAPSPQKLNWFHPLLSFYLTIPYTFAYWIIYVNLFHSQNGTQLFNKIQGSLQRF